MKNNEIDQAIFDIVIEAAGLDIWENELLSGRIVRKATQVYAELGYTEEEASATLDDLFTIVHPDDVQSVQQALKNHLDGLTPRYHCEFRLLSKTGQWVWYANYGIITEHNGRETGKHLVGVTYNVNARRNGEEELKRLNAELALQNEKLEQLNESLHTLAMLDVLTNLPNRRLIINRVEQAIALTRRTGKIGALLFVDSDNFKAVNDLHGHQAGDLLLQAIADRLVASVRKSDTVARLAGDEFVVLLENLGDSVSAAASEADVVGQKIVAELAKPYALPSGPYANSCSVGATLLDQRVASFDELCRQADVAMYDAKKAGRNTYRMFKPPGA
jgi:diguanylate cyclase (GGDEF)-like protein